MVYRIPAAEQELGTYPLAMKSTNALGKKITLTLTLTIGPNIAKAMGMLLSAQMLFTLRITRGMTQHQKKSSYVSITV
jgi:ABC-type dipeptide/oligopeptide/nickel transport system permease subunit